MTTRARAVAAAIVVAVAGGCVHHGHGTLDAAQALARGAAARLASVSEAERREYLRRARIFDDVDPRKRDILIGPPDTHAFGFDERVSCNFVEPTTAHVPTGGTTPKFFCTLRHGHGRGVVAVKVRYGRDNRELYGEMLGSRLLWALGVATDHDYAVHVRCHHCPADPWASYRNFPKPDPSPRETREFADAVVQRLYPGAVIESRRDEGWLFSELDSVDERVGGAPKAERDALVLLAAFIAHGDDKAENQRLVCPFTAVTADGRCREPRLMIADLGSTFGRGASPVLGVIDKAARTSLAAWSALPVWEDVASCRVHKSARASPPNPTIGEAGRRFLAERLAALSDAQIRSLFIVARIDRLGDATVDEWVAAFKKKRAEIVSARCPG